MTFRFVLYVTLCDIVICLSKRSLLEFRDVIHCATGRESFTSFNNYGCHCGYGGRGNVVDQIDRCCYDHDRCYELTRKNNVCNKFLIYVTPYTWECQTPLEPRQRFMSLALKSLKVRDGISTQQGSMRKQFYDIINSTMVHPTISPKGIPVCLSSPIQCGALLCKCDIVAALCFANYVYPKQKPKCKFGCTYCNAEYFCLLSTVVQIFRASGKNN